MFTLLLQKDPTPPGPDILEGRGDLPYHLGRQPLFQLSPISLYNRIGNLGLFIHYSLDRVNLPGNGDLPDYLLALSFDVRKFPERSPLQYHLSLGEQTTLLGIDLTDPPLLSVLLINEPYPHRHARRTNLFLPRLYASTDLTILGPVSHILLKPDPHLFILYIVS